MTKKHFVFLLAIVVAAGIIFIVKSKTNKEYRDSLNEVINLHQGADPRIEKIVESKADLKRQIEVLKGEAQNLRASAKKATVVAGKVVDKKEELEKADQISAQVAEMEALVQELEEVEAELHAWKEDVATLLKDKKDKITKEMHGKLVAAKTKFTQINERFVKSTEKAVQALQQSQHQAQSEEKK
jgi:ABC-type transporter Mla subunit MlaD